MPRVLLTLILSAVATGSVSAGPLVDLLKARQQHVDALLKANPGELSPAQKKELEDALTGALDFHEMARAALGAEWDKRSPAEQKTFADAFEALLRASLLRRTNIYRVDSIEYGEEKVQGTSGTVHTTVRLKDATTDVDYTFGKAGGEWRIVDYALDGVSTVRNYRSQLAKILAKDGFSALVDRLHRRATTIRSEGEGSGPDKVG
jgi:ABC-type transporter MlaC component